MTNKAPNIGTENINRWITEKAQTIKDSRAERSAEWYKIRIEYFVYQHDRRRWEWQWKTRHIANTLNSWRAK